MPETRILSFGFPELIAMGAGPLMAMAACALLVVHRAFSPVRHALWWAASCALGALQWGLMAGNGLYARASLHAGLPAHACAFASTLLLVEGFRVRAVPRPPLAPLLLIGGAGAIGVATAMVAPGLPLRVVLAPLAGAVLLGWAAAMLLRAEARPSPAGLAAVVTLLALAFVDLARVGLAVGVAARVVPEPHLDGLGYLVTAAPARAAVALSVLLLIAHDFAAELRRLSNSDPLTGILNRHGLDYAAGQILRRHRQRVLSVVIADIDFFKRVNDRHGHAAGDATLRAFAAHLAASLGRDGAVARIGGEEFALLLPGTTGGQAVDLIERARMALPSLRIESHPEVAVAASFGVAERRPGEPLDAVLARADAALYRAKHEGRDRTAFATRAEPAAA